MVQILNHYNSKHSLVNKTILGLFFIILLFSIQGKAEAQDAPAAPEITGSISGRVTDQDGQPLAGISVSAYRGSSSYFYKTATTDASGNYSLDGLVTGLYLLRFYDNAGNHLAEYYNDKRSSYDAEELSVAGNDIPGIDAALTKAGRIGGKISLAQGLVAGTSYIDLYRKYTNDDGWENVDSTSIEIKEGEQTKFEFDQLIDGTYRIRASGYNWSLPAEYYNNSLTLDQATDIPISNGTNITDISIVLGENPNAVEISGKVTNASGTPLPDILVTAYQTTTLSWYPEQRVRTDKDGIYKFSQLEEIDHVIGFHDDTKRYVAEYYNNATTQDSATPLRLLSGTALSNVNAQLTQSGVITGVIRFFDGSSPDYVNLLVYRASNQYSDPIYESFYVDREMPVYEIEHLYPDTYRILARASYNNQYIEEYYGDATTIEQAQEIVVSAGMTTTNINFSLGDILTASKINGRVRDEAGNPLSDIRVSAAFSPTYYYDSVVTYTNNSGEYQFFLLQVGEYLVQFADPDANYTAEYYDDIETPSLAKALQVVTGSTHSNINAILSPSGSISGTISMFNGVAPPSSLYVSLYRSTGTAWEEAQYVYTYSSQEENGINYQFKGLQPGIYRVGVRNAYGDENLTEFYNDKPTLESATNITISKGAVVSDINFVLGQDLANATISGKVITNGGLPTDLQIEMFKVETYGYGTLLVYVKPSADGTFRIAGLNEGLYRVAMHLGKPDDYYAPRIYWPNTASEEEATIIILGNTTTFSDVSFTLYQAYLPIISNQSDGR